MSYIFDLLESMSVGSRIVIIGTFTLMLWLFWKDWKSYKDVHKDYKSTIVSIGILGTFTGIFISLLSFDSDNISESVPGLLDGLRTAFITSIGGMFLSVLLSILQKGKGGEAEDELTILVNIGKKLDTLESVDRRLSNLEEIKKQAQTLPPINAKLDSIDTNTKELSISVSDVGQQLKNQKESTKEAELIFLKKLDHIDENLNNAVETLSRGATEEIIKALERVIQDFNSNLTEQFGDNFKQLNESVLKMIEWQKSYRDSIQEFENQLRITAENTEKSHQKTTELINTFAKENLGYIKDITDSYKIITEISEKLETVLGTNQKQITDLESHLNSLAQIGENAEEVTEKIKDFSKEIQGSLTNQSQALTELTKEIEKQLPDSLGELNKVLTSLTEKFATDYKNYLERIAELMNDTNTGQ